MRRMIYTGGTDGVPLIHSQFEEWEDMGVTDVLSQQVRMSTGYDHYYLDRDRAVIMGSIEAKETTNIKYHVRADFVGVLIEGTQIPISTPEYRAGLNTAIEEIIGAGADGITTDDFEYNTIGYDADDTSQEVELAEFAAELRNTVKDTDPSAEFSITYSYIGQVYRHCNIPMFRPFADFFLPQCYRLVGMPGHDHTGDAWLINEIETSLVDAGTTPCIPMLSTYYMSGGAAHPSSSIDMLNDMKLAIETNPDGYGLYYSDYLFNYFYCLIGYIDSRYYSKREYST